MAQQVLHARVLLASTNSLVDNPSIDLYFEATGSDVSIDFSQPETPTTDIKFFFNSVTGSQSKAVEYYLSNALDTSTNACKIEYYDVTTHLDGTNAGSPIRIDTFTLPGGAPGPALDPGAAVCCGYRRDYGSDIEHVPGSRPRARDRGRIYLGPLSIAALASGGSQVAALAVQDIGIAFDFLAQTSNLGQPSQFNLVQWSRKNASVASVRWFFVDEGFTYQRRRGDDTANRVHNWQAV